MGNLKSTNPKLCHFSIYICIGETTDVKLCPCVLAEDRRTKSSPSKRIAVAHLTLQYFKLDLLSDVAGSLQQELIIL